MLTAYLSGIFTMGLAIVGILFLRSWRETGDKLFLSFSFAFSLMAIERVILALTNTPSEPRSYVYLIRLVGYIVILHAIYQKNFGKRPRERVTTSHLRVVRRQKP